MNRFEQISSTVQTSTGWAASQVAFIDGAQAGARLSLMTMACYLQSMTL
jgi:hypothetical protein